MNKGEKTDYNHIIKYTGIFGGVQGITLLASILRNKLVAVLLGPGGMGLISVYNTVIKLLNDSTNLGISFSAVRNISEISAEENPARLEEFIRVVRSWSVLTGLFGMFVCIVLSSQLSYWTFDNYDYVSSFVWLSPVVALTAFSGGELAILKGVRKLRQVAFTSLLGALATLLVSVPLYYIWGVKGIIPSLVLAALALTWIVCSRSFALYPFRWPGSWKKDISSGTGMVRLGVSFILAGILGSGVEYVIRAFMLRTGSIDAVGLYNAGYAVTVTYAGMVFTAMETDYFPRLSAVNRDVIQRNLVVNRQIEVAVLLIAPLLVAFLVFLPFILPLLYSSKFLPVIGMAECATLGMFFRAVALPIAYISLARGDSFVYFILELVYDVCFVGLIIWGFELYGLAGTGVAISIASFADLLIIYFCARWKYKFRISKSVFGLFFLQIPWGIAAFSLTFLEKGIGVWAGSIACFLLSAAISLYLLHKKTSLLQSVRNRLKF